MRILRFAPGVFVLIFIALFAAGCGQSASVSQSDSPVFESCESRGTCEGGEDDQYIIAELKFDRPVSFTDDVKEQLRVLVGSQRIASENIEVSQPDDDSVLQLRMSVQQVNEGTLEITNAPGSDTLTSITDVGGKYCVESITVDQLIPSGASITTLKSEPGETVARVDSIVTHRSIIWIQIFRGDEVIEPSGSATTDIMDSACAVHEHDFLWATQESTAEDIAETVNQFYGESYIATADGTSVRITANAEGDEDTDSGNLQLVIYD